jgi:serine/threonine protein kinase
MQFEPGMRITDSIELQQMIGEGGMGQIWAGEHLLLGRPVAIKRLSSQLVDNVEARQRFEAEARTCARMECAHVARVFDYALLPDGTPFIVMELLEGIELHAYIQDCHILSLSDTTSLVTQMCAALTAIHRLGIVHRDVKPENIFLAKREGGGFLAKLLDFGIAKGAGAVECDELAKVGIAILGTPAYMSPEQLTNAGEVDLRADLWSLAVVVYSCLTGTMPFSGGSLATLATAVHQARYVAPTQLRPSLPAAIDGWFQKALSPDRQDRFSTATEMAEAFVRAATKVSTPPKPTLPAVRRLELVMTPLPSKAPASAYGSRRRGGLRLLTAAAAFLAIVAAGQPGYGRLWSTQSVRSALLSIYQVANTIPITLGADRPVAAGVPPRP